jgi:hypothetical protein
VVAALETRLALLEQDLAVTRRREEFLLRTVANPTFFAGSSANDAR